MGKTIKLIPLLLFSLLFSCNKQLDLVNPNEVQESSFWLTETDAFQGIMGVYDGFQSAQLAGDRYYRLDVLTDNMTTNTNSDGWIDLRSFANNRSNARIAGIWTGLYTVVNRANLAIAKIAAMPAGTLPEASRSRLLAEAKFLRAYAYHDLVMFYQGVPYFTTPNGPRSEGIAATKGSVILDALIQELNADVINNLPLSTSDGRVAKGAAVALLGKIYMFKKDYASAVSTLLPLKSAPYSYALHPNYAQLFTPEVEFSNREAMFQINFVNNQLDQGETFSFRIDTTTSPSVTPFLLPRSEYQVTNSLRDSYLYRDGKPLATNPIYGTKSALVNTTNPAIDRDPRFRAAIFSSLDKTRSNKPYWNFKTVAALAVKKYFYISPVVNVNGPQNFHMIRYADVLLMLAEAEVELNAGNPDIYANLSLIRQRAGVTMFTAAEFSALTQAQKRDAVRDERRWEFAFENVRFFDLRRWGIDYIKLHYVPTLTAGVVPPANDIDYIRWPYPLAETDNNPALANQPGGNPGF